MGDREYPGYAKDERKFIPWFLFAIVLFLVFSIVISAFQKTARSPSLDRNAQESSLAEKLKEVNRSEEKPPQPNANQQNPAQPPPPPPSFIGKIQTKMDLNLHSVPERSGQVIGSAPSGATLSVKSTAGNWYQVVTSDNLEGYITSNPNYVTVLEMKQ